MSRSAVGCARSERSGMTIPQLAEATGDERVHRPARARPHLGLALVPGADRGGVDVRLGHIVDGTEGRGAEGALPARTGGPPDLGDELRFHVTESRNPRRQRRPGSTGAQPPGRRGDRLRRRGALELQVRETVHRLETGESPRTRPGIRTPGATRRRPSRRSSCGWPSQSLRAAIIRPGLRDEAQVS